jgi:hypothetical protein
MVSCSVGDVSGDRGASQGDNQQVSDLLGGGQIAAFEPDSFPILEGPASVLPLEDGLRIASLFELIEEVDGLGYRSQTKMGMDCL